MSRDNRWPRIPHRRATALLLLLFCPWPGDAFAAANAAPPQSEAVDFGRDIQPIFAKHCLRCHGPDRQEGNLRLDQRPAPPFAGHTGSDPLAPGERNPILQRVTTADDALRMPRGAPPLGAEEIALLRRWAAAGANWDMPSATVDRRERFAFTRADWAHWKIWDWPPPKFQRLIAWRNRLLPPIALLIAWMLLCERCKAAAAKRQQSDKTPLAPPWRWLAGISSASHLAWALLLGLAAFGVYYQEQARRADETVAALDAQVQGLLGTPPTAAAATGPPRPLRPNHPPRLGGIYYRGNDERSPQLFNGGNYRTATMTLSLHAAAGAELRWGDELGDAPGPGWIRFRIEQAAGATEALFAPVIWEETFISGLPPHAAVTEPERQIVTFQQIDNRLWQADYPIALPGPEAAVSGTVYLYRGSPAAESINAQPHYAAEYHLTSENGRLAQQSELWMGHIFETSNVFRIPAGRISVEEWFSFRPIPEIQNGNTHDRSLLGVDEHLPDANPADPPEQ